MGTDTSTPGGNVRSRLAIGAAVTVTAALLAGCNLPGTVATVDGERITSRELAEASEIRNHLMIQPGTTVLTRMRC